MLGPAHPEFSDFALGHGLLIGADQLHFYARKHGADGCVGARGIFDAHLRDAGRAFGDAVAVMQRQAEEAFDGRFDRAGQRRSGAGNDAQGGQVERFDFSNFRVLQELLKHRRHAEHDGDAFFVERDAGGHGIEARGKIERCAAEQRSEEDDGESDNVGERKNSVEMVVWSERANFGRAGRGEEQVAVGEHHAFGQAGRSGSVDESGDAVGDVRVERLGLRGLVKRTEADCAEIADGFDDSSVAFGVFGGVGRDGGGVDDAAGFAVVADAIDFAGGEMGVDNDGPGVHAVGGEQDGGEGAAVFSDDHDAVAGADSFFVEPQFGFSDRGGELAVSPRAGGFDDGGVVGRAVGPGFEDVGDAGGGFGHVVRL